MMVEWELNRRSMVAHIALLVGASTLPAEAFAVVKKKGRAPARFLAPAPYAVMSAVADTLVPVTDTPGALAAGVPARLDGLLRRWASAETRQMLMSALVSVDKTALDMDKAGFAALAPTRRKDVLIAHEKAALKLVPRKDGLSGLSALLAGPAYADPGYARLKDLLVSLYYSSEIGLTQELIYEHVPGKWEPSLKITPGMHPYAGLGPF